jgi:hypothetical protein
MKDRKDWQLILLQVKKQPWRELRLNNKWPDRKKTHKMLYLRKVKDNLRSCRSRVRNMLSIVKLISKTS